jgi:hypothetical protein
MYSAGQTAYADEPAILMTVPGFGPYENHSGAFEDGDLVIDLPTANGLSTSRYSLARSDSAAYDAALRALKARNQTADKLAATAR